MMLLTDIKLLTQMPPGSISLVVDDDGKLQEEEILDLYRKIEESGTTPLMLVADAWKSFSIDLKESLLKVLKSVKDLRVPELLAAIVRKWGEMQGRDYRADPTATSACLNTETFEYIASAFRCFSNSPSVFGWPSGPKHEATVHGIRAVLKAAFEMEIIGRWVAAADTVEWLDEEEATQSGKTQRVMSTRLFNILIEECYQVMQLRHNRNNGAHPMVIHDTVRMQKMLELFKQLTNNHAPAVSRFVHLAKAAHHHNKLRLEEEMAAELNQPSSQASSFIVEVVDLRKKAD
jgi:hypothetical protein